MIYHYDIIKTYSQKHIGIIVLNVLPIVNRIFFFNIYVIGKNSIIIKC